MAASFSHENDQMAWTIRLRAAVARLRLRRKLSGRPEMKQRITNPWHAVSVATGLYACPAALAMRDKRMLSGEAPSLPLAACSDPKACTCRFRHHADRRSDQRRARDVGLPNRDYDYAGHDRRHTGRGRRATDIETMPFNTGR